MNFKKIIKCVDMKVVIMLLYSSTPYEGAQIFEN